MRGADPRIVSLDDGVFRREAVESRLRGDRISIGGEGARLDEQAMLPPPRPIKGNHQEMEIDREGIHHHHFMRTGADEAGGGGGQLLVMAEPGMTRGKMSLDAEARPVVQFLEDGFASAARLQAERMAGKIERRPLGKEEFAAQMRERIGGVLGARPLQ